MSRVETQNIIKLQLKKPRNWNWELSTLNTSSSIPLPIIQLYDNKKKLLVETKPFERKSWNGHDNTPKKTKSFNKLDINDRIKIKECLLKKSHSDLFNEDKTLSYKNKNYSNDNSKLKNDLLNNNIQVHRRKYTRSNTADILYNTSEQNSNHPIKKSNSISATSSNPQNYELRRSFKQTSLRNIHTILEEQENKNVNKQFIRNPSNQSVTIKELKADASRKNSTKYLSSKQNFQDIKRKNESSEDATRYRGGKHISSSFESKKSDILKSDSSTREVKYELRTSNAGTLLVNVDSLNDKKARRRRRSQLRNIPSSSDEDDLPVNDKRKSRHSLKSRSVNSVDKAFDDSKKRKLKSYSFNETNVSRSKLVFVINLKIVHFQKITKFSCINVID